MAQVSFPRLTQRDVENITQAHQDCQEVDRLLQATNWQAAGACRLLIGRVDTLICTLFNRVEARIMRAAARAGSGIQADSASQAATTQADAEPVPAQLGEGRE